MPQSPLRLSPRAPLKRWPLLLLGGAALGAIGIGVARELSRASVLSELAAARPTRVLSPRFSIPVEYHPCSILPAGKDETVPRESCGADDGRLAAFEALADAGESLEPDSVQASGLLAIIGDDETEQAADTAITRLSRALWLSPRRVPVLVDLSGAHLERAERTQNSLDLLVGLNYALEATAAEPRNLEARFNAALAMQALALDEQARIAWTEYLRIDSTSAWADEARKRRGSIRHPPAAQAPRPGAPEAEVRAFAEAHPQEARQHGWDSVLGDWGSAHEAGDSARAAELLQLADWLGSTLEERGGDASLADAVRAIHAAQDNPADTRALARAHWTYATAQRLVESSKHVAAGDLFARIVNARPPSPALVLWAEVFRAASTVYAKDYEKAESMLTELMPRIDSAQYPALAARALWMRGSGRLRSSDLNSARAPSQHSARLFQRAGETEFLGAVWLVEGESAFRQRDTLAAYDAMHRSLTALRGYRSSVRLHVTLFTLADCAAIDGLHRAAAVIQDEDVAVAMRDHRGTTAVEALLGRARIRSGGGWSPMAARDLTLADSLVAEIDEKDAREWFAKTVRFSRALVAPDRTSMAELDSAVVYFSKAGNTAWLLPALLQRADVRLVREDLAGVTADLDSATAHVRGLSEGLKKSWARAALMEHARSRFDQLVMLHLRAGDTTAALRAVERGRVSFAPEYGASELRAGPTEVAPGQVAVEYALIGDTLLTWTVRGSGVRLVRDTVDRGDFLRTTERVVTSLESPRRASSASTQADLEHLYDLLIRPVERLLGEPETPLVILADGEVAGVPFAALRDSASGRYLVEDHPLRFAATLAEASRPAPAAARSVHALLVADPAFDAEQYPTLDRLKGAREEVSSLKAFYPSHEVLEGGAATRAAVTGAAPRASIIHYAGHAVFDDARPERSALVLAGAGTTGRLAAEAVDALQLRGVRLVVLAACRTSRSRDERSGGLAGLSGAFLAAGAGGVVGSLWNTNDQLTHPLMLAFHQAYALHPGSPAAALRAAQLEMIRSPDPTKSSPAAWAGFRYIGS